MKKIFIAVLAVAALASCSKEQTVNVDKGAVIGFDNAFVENSTRANDLKVGNFNFGVYGSVINSQGQQGMIFTNQEVADDGSYSPAQYWIAGANYEFVAIAPYTDAWTYDPTEDTAAENGTITFNNETAVANQDLIFAHATAYTDDVFMAAPTKVGFTFNHMLSRVKFEFTNGTDADNNLTFKVTDVVLEGVHSEGTLAVADGAVAETWSVVGTDTFDKVFGDAGNAVIAAAANASTEHFYLIPATKQFTVKFKVTLFQAGVEFDTYDRTATVTLNMQKGMSYNVTAELDADTTLDDILKPIEFQVNGVENWEDFTNVAGTLN